MINPVILTCFVKFASYCPRAEFTQYITVSQKFSNFILGKMGKAEDSYFWI